MAFGPLNTLGNFLGFGSGPTVGINTQNQALDTLNDQNSFYNNGNFGSALSQALNGGNINSIVANSGMDANQQVGLGNYLATGALTGSQYATQQVQNNPILGRLFGNNGALSQATQQEEDLSKNGFSLQPEDYEAYGQAAGNIARQFGQTNNSLANSLAARGLSSGASGAAGAAYSGAAGTQNEQLANAQMQIAQQRYQMTTQRLGQLQNFTSQLGQQAGNDINQQYQRQLSGAENQQGALQNTASLQNQANQISNTAMLNQANFAQENKPANFMDYATAGMGSSIYNGFAAPGKFASSAAGSAGKAQGSQI